MAKYKNRYTGEEVEAFQWDKTLNISDTPGWFLEAYRRLQIGFSTDNTLVIIHCHELTTSYTIVACERDYIVGREGDSWREGKEICKYRPNNFHETYEPI